MTSSDAHLRIETDQGAIDIAVHVGRAPSTSSFVRQLVESGQFAGASIYRSTTLGVPHRRPLVQGGPLASLVLGSSTANREIPTMEAVETTNETGLRHRNGTVSLARDLDGTGHVLPELFVCLDDYPELDFAGRTEPDERGFPAFGTVVSGLDLVVAISACETDGVSPFERLTGEILSHPVSILGATYADPASESEN